MNTRTATTITLLAFLSLGAGLVPVRAALAEKPAHIEARQESEDLRKAPRQEPGRTQSRPVKQQAAPASRGTPAPRVPVVASQGGRSGGHGDRSRNETRTGDARNDRAYHGGNDRNPQRPRSNYVANRDHEGGSRQRYDSSRHHYAYTQSHYGSPRTVHHHYPSRRYYYPPRGYVAPVLPRNVVVVRHHHHNYWYGGGTWYRPYGTRYVVVAPPLGVYVSVLPSYYSTLWFGGVPYYYANSAYYVWRDTQRAYEVVAPPAGADTAPTDPVTEDLFVYPREGQGEEQVAFDRYECHRWASNATGFDPTQPWGGVSEDQAGALRQAYLRAMTACLEGRGYTVR